MAVNTTHAEYDGALLAWLRACDVIAREDSANLSTVKACSRVTLGDHSRNWSTVAPPSRFSKSADTGTRVPLKSHTPLTLPGTRFTAEHCVQSNMPHNLHPCITTGKPKAGGYLRRPSVDAELHEIGNY